LKLDHDRFPILTVRFVIAEVNAMYPELLTAPLNKFKPKKGEEATTAQASP
jgi:hypothetical protein